VGGIIGAVLVGLRSLQGPMLDALAYYQNAYQSPPPVVYEQLPGGDFAFLYSPAFSLVLAPLAALPQTAFLAIWVTALLLTLAWLVGPVLLLPMLLLAGIEIEFGNIHLFMAAAIVVGFRYPWTWALILLTKVTPGVGLLWFVARREWRHLAIALGATGAIAAISFLFDPQGWFGWIELLRRASDARDGGVALFAPIWLRVALAALIVWWGARRDAAWTVPVAATVALPVPWIGGLTVLLGALPLLRGSRFSPPPRQPEARP
jgi:hypothetical protein